MAFCAVATPSSHRFIFLRDSVPHGVLKDVNGQRQHAATNEERQNYEKTILLAIAAAGVFTFTASAQTGDAGITASPKLSQFLNESETRMVKGTPSTAVASVGYRATGRDGLTASPKLRHLIDDSRGVASTGPTVDYVHAPRPTMSPKDPRFESAWRANAEREFQVAPLK